MPSCTIWRLCLCCVGAAFYFDQVELLSQDLSIYFTTFQTETLGHSFQTLFLNQNINWIALENVSREMYVFTPGTWLCLKMSQKKYIYLPPGLCVLAGLHILRAPQTSATSDIGMQCFHPEMKSKSEQDYERKIVESFLQAAFSISSIICLLLLLWEPSKSANHLVDQHFLIHSKINCTSL